uniref:DEAD/DEAH box helicase n=1 Tax=viral metagenome TaxID=1070528 RepID=A0A6C0EP45_9ZZZZ
MLNIVDIHSKAPEVESPFKFPLDPFQKHAIYAISKNENVLVTAKTGSGKTLVGEYQIHHSLAKGKRVFYTTPIKSLSNQKFHDLKEMFPSVGIMTGDIKFCPQADIVIMTTEILRNLLFKQGTATECVGITANLSLENLDAVVFDEVHYINDPDRGKVWEECLTLLPPQVNLVLLSATIENPEKFAGWLGDIKQKPIHVISTEYRIVPLVHQLPNKAVILDSKDVFNRKAYIEWYNKYYEQEKEDRLHRERVSARQAGEDVVKKTQHSTSFVDRMNKLIIEMELPALFFVFSRKLCVELANKVTDQLIDSSEAASVRHIVSFHLHRYPYLEKSQQYHDLFALLQKGVAYHHSGVLPILKEIVEILFARGFIKVLFATETFAVGINMPTKTVVFTSYRKYDDKTENHRMLTTSEYIQMAGRAGRRGKDDKGIVIYLPMRDPESPVTIHTMMTGKKAVINSQMDFHYSYILAAIQSGRNIIGDTYWASEMCDDIRVIKNKILEKRKEIIDMDENTVEELEKYTELKQLFDNSVNAERKKWQAEIGRWNNTHFGPKWEKAMKSFKKTSQVLKEIEFMTECIYKLSYFEEKINLRKNTLLANGFLDEDDELTTRGVLASEIHEGHPLLMAYIYDTRMIHNKSANEIVECLSIFLEDVRTDEYIQKTQFHDMMNTYVSHIIESELLKSDLSYWKLTSYWVEVVQRWMNGDDFVCEQLGIEQGNFVRAMLKLSNIIDEWNNLATISQDVEMLEKMKEVKGLIVRGFVIPDSLYLRI